MFLLQTSIMPKSILPSSAVNLNPGSHPFSLFSLQNPNPNVIPSSSMSSSIHRNRIRRPLLCFSVLGKSDSKPDPEPPKADSKPKTRGRRQKTEVSQNKDDNPDRIFPKTIPRKLRRGRKSEAAAVEDFVRDSLEQTFASIQQQNSEIFENKENIMKDRVDDKIDSDSSNNDEDVGVHGGREKEMVVEEENANWPLDAEVGWGIRASEYFEQHPIRNVMGEDGVEINWEGEIDDGWVKEINCLEWESFAFHPSPLIVLVFERYNRATDNWKVLKELEKAAKVYWSAKDRLPPRTVKIDINIERDLAYALKVKECPQILFLRGNRILYREKGEIYDFAFKNYKKHIFVQLLLFHGYVEDPCLPLSNVTLVFSEIRTADELVQMIAHFYYNAKKPSWIDNAALSPY